MIKRARTYVFSCLTAAIALAAGVAMAQEHPDPPTPQVLSERAQAQVIDAWLKERLDTVVLPLMRREGVDMWILVAGEYDEDPVVRTMLPATWLNARRVTILVFHDNGGDAVERLAVARYPVADLFPAAWDPETQPDQWARVAEIIRERNPKTIALNTSEDFPLADGLSHGMRRQLETALGPWRNVSSSALVWPWAGWKPAHPRKWQPIPRSCESHTRSWPRCFPRKRLRPA